jgi:hypothetical protein
MKYYHKKFINNLNNFIIKEKKRMAKEGASKEIIMSVISTTFKVLGKKAELFKERLNKKI